MSFTLVSPSHEDIGGAPSMQSSYNLPEWSDVGYSWKRAVSIVSA